MLIIILANVELTYISFSNIWLVLVTSIPT